MGGGARGGDGSGGKGGGSIGGGGGSGDTERGPQSVQSVPSKQRLYTEPLPPSSHIPSLTQPGRSHESEHVRGGAGLGGDSGDGDGGDVGGDGGNGGGGGNAGGGCGASGANAKLQTYPIGTRLYPIKNS